MVHRITLTLLLLALLAPQAAWSQTAELEALNTLFSGSVVMKLDRKQQLVIDLYDASGRFRQDVVAASSVDPATIHFSAEEDAIILGCVSPDARCFRKELFKSNSVRMTGRCNLPRPLEDAGGSATIEALRAFIEAHAATAAETRSSGQRMK